MLQQRDARWWHKINAATRLTLVSGALRKGQLPLLNEYPKSGGSWMAQMLAEALQIPFPRNRLPMLSRSLLHGHYRYNRVGQPTVIVWRDGRDLLVSFYYHRLVGNALTLSSITEKAQADLGVKDPNDIETYLPRFIEYMAQGKTHPHYSWSDFVKEWHGSDKALCEIFYESMLNDSAKELIRACQALGYDLEPARAQKIADTYSFQKQAGRKAGEENTSSYLRKGIAGDWKSKFSAEAREVFDHYMGAELIALGYEPDRIWVG